MNLRITVLAATILVYPGAVSTFAYTLPNLPALPVITPAPANSMPMGDPATFAEVNMDFAIETNGPFQPTWSSIASNNTNRDNGAPAWLRQAKFGMWVHYGPQANLQSGDWSAQHMYQPGAAAYSFHTNNFGWPTTNGYKERRPRLESDQLQPRRAGAALLQRRRAVCAGAGRAPRQL